MTLPHTTVTLTDEQIAFYHTHGYLVLESATTAEELAQLREIYDRLFAEKVGWDDGMQFDLAGTDEDGQALSLPQLLSPSKYAPELLTTIYRANVLAITRQLIGPTAGYQGEHMILKPAGYGVATPWHQDEAYWNPKLNYTTTNFWMPLQDATLESGCLHFIPGSHRLEVLEHQSIGGDDRVHVLELADNRVDLSNAVACPIPAGGVTIHASRTLHYAGANTTDEPRRAYIMGGGLPATQRETPRRFPWLERKQTARQQRAATKQEAGS